MTHFLLMLSNPEMPVLDGARANDMRARLPLAQEPRWLNDGIAVEIPFTPQQPLLRAARRGLAAELRGTLNGASIDVVVIEAAVRKKHLLLADMDSTMIRQECIDELGAEVGLKDHIAAITIRAMRGEIAFEPALRERVALLRGLPAGVADKVIAERIELMPGGRALIATMRANGAHTALVSGGFTLFTGPISRMLGFDEHRSNALGVADGKLDGTVRDPILGADAKRAALIELRAAKGLAREDVIAVGDGANDLAMLDEAGLGVALHAKPQVAAAADARIDHGDLTALLYLQGYGVREIVGG